VTRVEIVRRAANAEAPAEPAARAAGSA